MQIQELQTQRDEILSIATRHGAYNVRVFGSIAWGDASGHSDVDFLVELEEGRSLLDHAGLIVDLERLLGCPVDVIVEQGLRTRIRETVLAEATEL